ncbi:hypothetical protein, partial [Streptomyces sp. NPDC086010]|uniref:hypothetical protein n=1 Tax=Streptomyces sp. NPDC086010 TaxID=3365745 RepID=UPI0037CE3481
SSRNRRNTTPNSSNGACTSPRIRFALPFGGTTPVNTATKYRHHSSPSPTTTHLLPHRVNQDIRIENARKLPGKIPEPADTPQRQHGLVRLQDYQ